jgi:hypothetical protein
MNVPFPLSPIMTGLLLEMGPFFCTC